MIKIRDHVYSPHRTGLKMHVYVLADSKMNIPARTLRFVSKKNDLEYITAFNNRHHLEYLKEYSNHPYEINKVSLSELMSSCKEQDRGILIIDNMYCKINDKKTVFRAISIDCEVNHHVINYVP